MTQLLLLVALSYLVGAIPTSFIVGKGVKGIDLRKHGSGNLGATNVNRVLGAKWGFLVLGLDALKGVVAVVFIARLGFDGSLYTLEVSRALCGFAAIVGHVWTIFLGFKGGKGVATSAGVFFALSWPATLLAAVVCIGLIALTRYVSVGSIAGAVILPIGMVLFKEPDLYLTLSMLMSALVVSKHKQNVKRLVLGQENKLSFSKSAKSCKLDKTAN